MDHNIDAQKVIEEFSSDVAASNQGGEDVLDSLLDSGDNSDIDPDDLVERNKRYQSIWDNLQSKGDSKVSRQEFENAVALAESMNSIENQKDRIGFDQAILMETFVNEEMWVPLNYDSFNEYFSSPDSRISRQAAYRYRSVGEMMNDLHISDEDWSQDFHERYTAVEWEEIVDDSGNVMVDETKKANVLSNKLGFANTARVSGLYGKGTIGMSRAEELLALSLIASYEDFDREIKKITGNLNEKEEESQQELGLVGPQLLFPLKSGTKGQLVTSLRETIDNIQDASTDALEDQLDHPDTDAIGSAKAKFYKLADGTIIAVI
jgi:hypothetical protein